MTFQRHSSTHTTAKHDGLSLLEVVVSIMLVGVVLLGATNLLGSVIRGRTGTSDRAVGELLAQQLMTEILRLPYRDPDGLALFGWELDEFGTATRYDDIDDYLLYSDEWPLDEEGNPVYESAGWTRHVTVVWIDPEQPDVVVFYPSGLKRVTITIQKAGTEVAKLVALSNDL